MPGRDTDERLAVFQSRIADVTQRLAGEVRHYDVGWGVRTRDLTPVWTLNQLSVTVPATVDAICATADAHQADLGYRHVRVQHEATALAVEPELAARGWRVERDVVMALEAEPERAVDGTTAIELTEDQMAALMDEWLREEFPGVDDASVAAVVEYNKREGRLFGERRLGVVDQDGAPLSVTKLRVDGSFGWVEDVFTTPRARGNGFARTLVTLAAEGARDAGCELVVIVADADDWPQHLYRSVGFRPIGSARIFHLPDVRGA